MTLFFGLFFDLPVLQRSIDLFFFMASNFIKHIEDWEVSIPETNEINGVIFYVLHLRIDAVKWTVKHRYSDFAELHRALVLNHGVSKDMLPGKTIFYVRKNSFIDSRRDSLQKYINKILRYLSNTMPPVLVHFLELDKYDVWFLLKDLSNKIKVNGWIENPPGSCDISLIEGNAISERLKLPSPPAGIINSQDEFSTVLEFCNFLKKIIIRGENDEYFGSSNINCRNLPFELSSFKSLHSLVLLNMYINNLVRADDARRQMKHLSVNGCKIEKIAEILLCDHLHLDWKENNEIKVWHELEKLDVQYNKIVNIDSGLELITSVIELNASNNQIQSLANISKLQNLKTLLVSHNNITSVIDWNLPFLTYLNISNNKIKSVVGIDQLLSLETLFVSFNLIEEFGELNSLSKLKKLVNLDLVGNPISQKTDYRVKVLIKFGPRVSSVCLDNEAPTAHELELVAVMQAINFVQEGKLPSYTKNLSLKNNPVT